MAHVKKLVQVTRQEMLDSLKCDRCEFEIAAANIHERVSGEGWGILHLAGTTFANKDICPSCMTSALDFLAGRGTNK